MENVARASGKLGGVVGVLLGVHICGGVRWVMDGVLEFQPPHHWRSGCIPHQGMLDSSGRYWNTQRCTVWVAPPEHGGCLGRFSSPGRASSSCEGHFGHPGCSKHWGAVGLGRGDAALMPAAPCRERQGRGDAIRTSLMGGESFGVPQDPVQPAPCPPAPLRTPLGHRKAGPPGTQGTGRAPRGSWYGPCFLCAELNLVPSPPPSRTDPALFEANLAKNPRSSR